MAYTPIGWQTGDTITAEKLNKMDNGWSITTELDTVYDGSVTTESGSMGFEGQIEDLEITSEKIYVTFENTRYECPVIDAFGMKFYGGFGEEGPVFTEFPFLISYENGNDYVIVYTETAGTYTLNIEAEIPHAETSSDFQTAVMGAANNPNVAQFIVQSVTRSKTINALYVGIGSGRNMESVSIPAHGMQNVRFNTESYSGNWSPNDLTPYIAVLDIANASSYQDIIAIVTGRSGNYVYVNVYNPTDTAITAASDSIKLRFIAFGFPEFGSSVRVLTAGWE